MSEDKREQIFVGIVAELKTVVDPDNVFRNRTEIPESKRPALVLLDGDEARQEGDVFKPSNAGVVVLMTPEIFILSQEKADEVGTALNTLRAQVIKAIVHSTTIKALCKDGEIRYEGFSTALSSGRSMEGQARVHFTFPYYLRPDKL